MRIFLIAPIILLSACSSINNMQQSLTDLTTSSLVGTWAGELQCLNQLDQQQVLLTFQQSSFPLIAQGQSYSKAIRGSNIEFLTIQIEGEMSLAGIAHITEKAWIVKSSPRWELIPWHGKRTSPNTINMNTCGTNLVLTKVSNDFISELNPKIVFGQYGYYFNTAKSH